MSVIKRKPFIEKVLASMSATELNELQTQLNVDGNEVPNKEISEIPVGVNTYLVKLNEFLVVPCICIRNANYSVALGYGDNQSINIYNLKIGVGSYTKIKEYLTISELRRVLSETIMGNSGTKIVRLQYDDSTLPNPPTHDSVKAFVIASGYDNEDEWGNIIVIIKSSQISWTYIQVSASPQRFEWVGGGTDIVSPFNNTRQGTVIGDEHDGYIEHLAGDSDGIAHVHGWERKVNIITPPASTTLTDAEKASITGGVFVNGTFLGLVNPMFYPANASGSQLVGLVIGQQSGSTTTMFCEYIINNSNVIALKKQDGNTKNYFLSLNNDRLIEITSLKAPTLETDATNKKYVDDLIAKKVDRQYETGTNVYLYGFNSAGDTKYRLTTAASGATVALRGSTGTLAVGDASTDNHAVPLKQAKTLFVNQKKAATTDSKTYAYGFTKDGEVDIDISNLGKVKDVQGNDGGTYSTLVDANGIAKIDLNAKLSTKTAITTDDKTYLYGYNRSGQTNPLIIDNVTTDSATDVLSAKQGKYLNDRIDSLTGVGRYLSGWNANSTSANGGKPDTDPGTIPYAYQTGDYYTVSSVDSESDYLDYVETKVYDAGDKCKYNSAFYICNSTTTGTFDPTKWTAHTITNYKPVGLNYTGVASTTVETNAIQVNDTYKFDGTTWQLISTGGNYIAYRDGVGKGTTHLENVIVAGDTVLGDVEVRGNTEFLNPISIPDAIGNDEAVSLQQLNKRVLYLSANPTTDTVGVKGQLALVSTTNRVYQCTAVDETSSPKVYTWEEYSIRLDNESLIKADGVTQVSYGGKYIQVNETVMSNFTTGDRVDDNIYKITSVGTPETTKVTTGNKLVGSFKYNGTTHSVNETIEDITITGATSGTEYNVQGITLWSGFTTGQDLMLLFYQGISGNSETWLALTSDNIATYLTSSGITDIYLSKSTISTSQIRCEVVPVSSTYFTRNSEDNEIIPRYETTMSMETTRAPTTATVYQAILDVDNKFSSSVTSSNKALSESEIDEKISLVEANQLYKTNAQGSFATKAELTSATTFYGADGSVATPTKNDVAYVLADESHDNKLAKYVVASVSGTTPTWAFVIVMSTTTGAITGVKLNGNTLTPTAGVVNVSGVVVTTGAQEISGVKTFNNAVTVSSGYSSIINKVDNGVLGICGGTSSNHSFVRLYGNSYSEKPAWFEIGASNGLAANTCTLAGTKDGALTWTIGTNSAYNVLHDHNGVTLDTAQEISGAKTFSANLTMNDKSIIVKDGDEAICMASNDEYITIVGGTSHIDTPRIQLNGKNRDTKAGQVELIAADGTNEKYLKLNPNGVATWGGKRVVIDNSTINYYSASSTYAVGDLCMYSGVYYRCTTAITTAEEWTSSHWTSISGIVTAGSFVAKKGDNALVTTTDDSFISIVGGTTYSNTPRIQLNGKNRNTKAGIIEIITSDGTNSKTMTLNPDGTLTWNGNSLVGVKNTPTAGTGITISNTTCTYTRVGNMVYVWGIPTIASGTYSSGTTLISGLPANISNGYGTGIISIGNKSYRLRMDLDGTTITWLDSCTLTSSAYGSFTFMYLAK